VSVTNTAVIERLPWSMELGPGLPTGIWRGEIGVAGDASGGDRSVELIFQLTADALSARIYHLGQLTIRASVETADSQFHLSCSMGWARANFGANPSFNSLRCVGTLVEDPVLGESQLSPADMAAFQKGQLLGAPFNPATQAQIQLFVPNVDGSTLTLTAMGYVWDQVAINSNSGIRFPANGILNPR